MDAILDVVGSAGGPRVVLVHGPAGIGRTTLLDRVCAAVTGRAGDVLRVRYTPDGPTTLDHETPAGPAGVPRALMRPAVGARHSPDAARRAAAGIAPVLVQHGTALLVDDLHWADPDSLAVLEAVLRRIAGTPASCVCTVRTPVTPALRAAVDAVRRLRADGLLVSTRLRPLDRAGTTALLRRDVGAVPDSELVTALQRAGRGVPGAVHDLLGTLRADGRIVISDRHAYLGPDVCGDVPRPDRPVLRGLRRLGPEVWAAAKAVAVLAPLGPAVPRLLARSLDVPVDRARTLLDRLVDEGVLHRGRDGASWRFPLPLVADGLSRCLGPYEGRRVAAVAVTAMWDGEAAADDPDYLTDRIAQAGTLVDADRARAALVARARTEMLTHRERARNWWRAAAELPQSRPSRAVARWMYAITCYLCGAYVEAVEATEEVLVQFPDELSDGTLQEVHGVLLSAMHNTGDLDGLRAVADGHRELPGDVTARSVSRGMALALLDRWEECRQLLEETRWAWGPSSSGSTLGELFLMLAELWSGRPERFRNRVSAAGQWPDELDPQRRMNQVKALCNSLMVLSEPDAALDLLAAEGMTVDELNPSDQAVLAFQQGRPDEGADLARRAVIGGREHGYDTGRGSMAQHGAFMLIARGQLTRAREVLTSARTVRPVLEHLLENPDAEIDRILGEPGQARDRLRASLDLAVERGLLVGAELTWAQLGELAIEAGDHAAAAAACTEIDRVAEAMRTSRAEGYALLLRACVQQDAGPAAEAVRVMRSRGQPYELALTISKLAQYGVGDPKDLREAYDLFGDLDALLCRSWTRSMMTQADIPIPGRATAVAENERLLALLVGHGLGNKRLATILRTSEKSVEGRLGRLFARTGYRSRTELATAMRTGEYEG